MTRCKIKNMKYFQKIWTIFLSVALCSTSIAQVHTITFTGKDWTNQYHIPLHHVTVFNLDQLWEEVLYYPDTTLVLGTVGVDSYNVQDVQLMQNVPNPFDGITEFALVLPEGGDVQMEIYDIAGRLAVGRHFSDLQAGTHLFQTTLASPQTYLLSAKVEGGQMTIKMVNEGHGAGNTIQHLGMANLQGDFTLYLKNDKYSGGYPFSVGDEMKYTGYALIDGGMKESNIIQCHQNNNDTYTLQFDVTAPTVTTASANSITSYSAICGGNVTVSGGSPVVARGVCWSTSHNPTLSNSYVENGTGLGSFTCSITGLTTGTTYYVRAYATNGVGTAYGSEKSFTTLSLPTVTTNTVTNIMGVTATSGGQVTSDGGDYVTARGVCWSTSQNPTESGSHTTNGNGTGSFTSNITGLSTSTTYYVRAYATNSVGTAYGEQRSFTTLNACPDSPTITDYDGNIYNTVQIGSQCWMAENLRTTHYANGASITLGTDTSTITAYRYYPGNSASYVSSYGYLYNWKALMRNYTGGDNANPSGVQGVCPSGWHLPSFAEWEQLGLYLESQSLYQCGGENEYVAKSIASTTGWDESSYFCSIGNDQASNNSSGFNAKPTGYYYSGGTSGFGSSTVFWNTCVNANQGIPCLVFSMISSSFFNHYTAHKSQGLPVRCVKGGNYLPEITTSNVSSMTGTTAVCGGNVINSGSSSVSARGVCWSTTQNPTVSNSHTTNGSGTGSFTSNITGLIAGATYYVRAYATNSVGTAYGMQHSFTTTTTTPSVSTSVVSNILQTTAVCGGNVSATGGSPVTVRGVCWSTSSYPTINDSHTTNGSGTGSFTSNITGLSPGTTYYVRAYATNSEGTGYGAQKAFTTEAAGSVIDEKSCPAAPTVTDHEGNVYATVQIGNQCWMRDNLRTATSPSTGTYLIPDASASDTYTGKQARWYDNDSATYAPMDFGLLYNWNAAADTFNTAYGETSVNTDFNNAVSMTFNGHRRGICPTGWHLPSDSEWTQLTNYVRSQSVYTCGSNSNCIGKAMASETGWNSYTGGNCTVGNNPSANNATGFSAVPAGYFFDSSFDYVGEVASFWSSSTPSIQYYSYRAWYRIIDYDRCGVDSNLLSKYCGLSVRCLKN